MGGVVALGDLGLRWNMAAALSLLEDVQALAQAAQCGSRRSFEQEQVLIQTGERPFGGQGVDGLDKVLLLALCLGHNLWMHSET